MAMVKLPGEWCGHAHEVVVNTQHIMWMTPERNPATSEWLTDRSILYLGGSGNTNIYKILLPLDALKARVEAADRGEVSA
ncbi:MAG: hypothetical protein ABFE07_28220 [Armatimonadia bacterium]